MPGPKVPTQRHADSAPGRGASPAATREHRADPGDKTTTTATEAAVEPSARSSEDLDAEMTAMADLLVRGLRALGGAGHVDLASRLAGQAWSVLRTRHERSADRLNGLLHYLARLPDLQAATTFTSSTPRSKP